MDILFLCHRIPYPPNKGDKIRSHALLRHLARSHRVHAACFVDDPADLGYCHAVREIAGGECLFVPVTEGRKWLRAAAACLTGQPVTAAYLHCRAIHKWITKLARSYRIDRTVVFGSGMAPYVLDHQQLDSSRAILDMADVDSDKWQQYAEVARWPRAWVYRREAKRLRKLERAAANRFAATLLVSDFEARTFATIAPESAPRIFAIENGVDLNYYAPGCFPNPFRSDEIPIVMTGRMDYRPNIDAVEWFLCAVLPQLKSRLPSVRFYAVGANPPGSWRNGHKADLAISGQVQDIRPYIQHSAAVVAPLRIARGVQNKVLEAMAMEKSVVATREATQALAVTSGVEVLIENDPARFANAVVTAIRCSQLGQNARRYVEEHHNWTRNLSDLDLLLDCVGKPPVNATPNPDANVQGRLRTPITATQKQVRETIR